MPRNSAPATSLTSAFLPLGKSFPRWWSPLALFARRPRGSRPVSPGAQQRLDRVVEVDPGGIFRALGIAGHDGLDDGAVLLKGVSRAPGGQERLEVVPDRLVPQPVHNLRCRLMTADLADPVVEHPVKLRKPEAVVGLDRLLHLRDQLEQV